MRHVLDLLSIKRYADERAAPKQPLVFFPWNVAETKSFFFQIVEIARQCGKSPAQVILSWAVQRGAAVIPKTSDKNRLAENIGLSRLSEEHCEKIDRLSQESGNVRYLDPAGHIGFDIFNEEADEPVWNSAPWD